ncbi:class I SAM-dependent methyltransferase [Metabacillus litoralis]|uniref:class I SAM-dependent DNA methyltransferase n=2 Tax=Metabacillus TaxID=2675233 RepID=UPI000EF5B8D2|nr:class I SAM-dependent methyltransferase [Metabacillus litoralis]MCM3413038.1 class I SAM-dependent methyltransferase [Metabacillus litoralis]UHA62415.1 class I SAM-dependent methyltransferase [Metabacillus litoralis]
MIYKGFAYIYDHLMKDAPYDQWVGFIQDSIAKYHKGATTLLDVACGTGEIAVSLAKNNLEVTGVDLSEDMLTVAQSKAERNKVNLLFLKQDMRKLNGFPKLFDVVTICCDSLNYLETKEDIKATFHSVFEQLEEDGLFIFDVHSIHKIHHVFANHTFADQDEEVSFIWNSFLGDEEHSIEHDMTFFVRREQLYERYDEVHYQRTYSIEEYTSLLAAASFQVLKICSDFQVESQPHSSAERIFFICKKTKVNS